MIHLWIQLPILLISALNIAKSVKNQINDDDNDENDKDDNDNELPRRKVLLSSTK